MSQLWKEMPSKNNVGDLCEPQKIWPGQTEEALDVVVGVEAEMGQNAGDKVAVINSYSFIIFRRFS